MATSSRINLVIQDDNGTKIDGASIEVRNEATTSLVPLFSDRAGTVSLGNPFVAASGADAGFFVTGGGAYKITATKGAFSKIIRYQAAGLAAESDVTTSPSQVKAIMGLGYEFGGNLYNVKTDFGAVGNGSGDDTTAIQNALNAIPSGGALYFPWGNYRITSAGLTRADPIHIFGDGLGSRIFLDGTTPTTRDILTITGSATQRGYQIDHMYFDCNNLGRYAINFDIAPPLIMYHINLHDLNFNASSAGTAATYSIHLRSTYYMTIQRCLMWGVLIEDGGDGIVIRDNNLSNGIAASFAPGAGGFFVVGNVIAGSQFLFFLAAGVGVTFAYNELETPNLVPNTYGILIDLGFGGGIVHSCRFIGNTISVLTGTGDPLPYNIRANCSNIYIDDNRNGILSGSHIQIVAGATDITINSACTYALNNVNVQAIVADAGGFRVGYIPPGTYEIALQTATAGTQTASAQNWFPAAPNFFPLVAGTVYEFEGHLMISKSAGTTSRTLGLLFPITGGTYTVFNYEFIAAGADAAAFTGTQNPLFGYVEVSTVQTVFGIASTSAAQVIAVRVRGYLKVGTAGAFTPQFQYSADPGGAPTVRPGTFFKIWASR